MIRSCLVCIIALSVLFGCGPVSEENPDYGQTGDPLAADTARGVVPAGLPSRLLVGLFEDTGGSWMRTSGAAWDVRYRYLTKGWANNWGFGAYDGGFALSYMNECAQQGYVPAVQYYQIFGEPGGGESATLTKLRNATTMRSYFGDFKLLMQRVKDFNRPAYVLIEADALGFLEQQAGNDPNASAAVASTGMPELAGLPNTVAGFGLAFLKLKQAVGASQAILGIHISGWASGKDVAYFNVTDPLQPEVDRVYSFLAPAGLAANVTGITYDVLVGDPLDRDADFYRLTNGQDRWWDASDGASISSKSFNRYAEWLRLWNVKSNRRWVLWQIPLGNSNARNVYNDNAPAGGYKDNRPEYFFLNGTAHLTKFADAGVVALLFGAGAGGQSTYTNDTYGDGQLFMKSRAGAFLNAGGLAIADGRGGGGGGSGGATGAGGASSGGTPSTGGASAGGASSGGASAGGASAGGASAGGASAGGAGTGGSGGCTLAAVGTGTGLKGDYYSGRTFGTLVTTRTDATVDFDWGSGSPATGVGVNDFAVRFTGQVRSRYTGPVTFTTRSDDGVRLWVNGQLLIDDWTDHGATERSGTISLTAGQRYDLKLEYYENGGGATIRLYWSNACQTRQIVPSSELFAPSSDPSQYGFETSTQSWSTTGTGIASLTSSTDRAFAGSRSLKVGFGGTPGSGMARVGSPAAPRSATVSFRVWIPSGAPITSIQPYLLQGAAGGWAWTGSWRAVTSLVRDQWNTVTVQVPANAAVPLAELGVEFVTNASYTGSAYVDAVAW